MLMLLCISIAVVAQNAQNSQTRKLSPYVRRALTESQRQSPVTRGGDAQKSPQHILAFVKAHDAQSLLQKHGCQVYAQWGNIQIAQIPLTSLAALSAESQVERIEAHGPARLMLDTSAIVINALPVYEATPVHQAYTGDGVVMGLMDVGFDLTHPNFYNRDLTHSRISAIWDMLSPDTIGSTLPVGRDYIGTEAVQAHTSSADAEIMVHGTHTLGIAAGTGYDTPYRGMAFDSDICLVSNIVEEDTAYFEGSDKYFYTNALEVLGFKYLFDYADRQGKPCVASFSEGYYPLFDEEDSLFAAVLDSLSGPGHIIVASAGNEGLMKSYFEKRPETKEDGSFIRCYYDETYYRIKGSGPLRLHLYHYGDVPGVPVDTYTIDLDTLSYECDVTDTFIINGDSLYIDLYRNPSTYPPDDVWHLTLYSSQILRRFWPLALTLEGDNHAEVFGEANADFQNCDLDPRWQAGQAGHNILAPSSFESVISVGASTHRMQGQTMNGSYNVHAGTVLGHISPYSSTGPTVDGRIKPDVVAPGTNIISSFSHILPPENALMRESEFQGLTYPWGVETGTSMSAPMVAGTIALWLQACPTLTPADILQVFRRTCQHPDPELSYPNMIYGYGEIDAYRGLLDILGVDQIDGLSLHQPTALHVYPSGSGLRLTTDTPISETIRIKLYSLSGTCIHEASVRIDGTEAFLPLPPLAAAVYVVQLNAPTRTLSGSQLVRL
jgi:subtilisin family serine protease